MKKIVVLFTTLSILLAMNLTTYATTMENQVTISKVFRVTELGLKEVPVSEYLNSPVHTVNTNSDTYSSIESKPKARSWVDQYYKELSVSKNVRRTDLRRRVSKILDNREGSLPNSISVQYTTSQSHSLSGGVQLSFGEKIQVLGGISYAYSKSASVSDQYTMNVPSGKYGWLEFDPIMDCSHGKLWKIVYGREEDVKYIDSYFPKKLNKKLDGYIVVCESYVSPY